MPLALLALCLAFAGGHAAIDVGGLKAMKFSKLQQMAYAEGISEAVVDDCLEDDGPKPCIIKALTALAEKQAKEEKKAPKNDEKKEAKAPAAAEEESCSAEPVEGVDVRPFSSPRRPFPPPYSFAAFIQTPRNSHGPWNSATEARIARRRARAARWRRRARRS